MEAIDRHLYQPNFYEAVVREIAEEMEPPC